MGISLKLFTLFVGVDCWNHELVHGVQNNSVVGIVTRISSCFIRVCEEHASCCAPSSRLGALAFSIQCYSLCVALADQLHLMLAHLCGEETHPFRKALVPIFYVAGHCAFCMLKGIFDAINDELIVLLDVETWEEYRLRHWFSSSSRMEWTKPHQFTHPLQSPPWYNFDGEEEKEHEATLNTDQYGACRVMLPQQLCSSLKTEIPSTLGNEGGAGMTFQSLSSLNMSHLDDATEFQPFYSSQSVSFPDSATLPPSLPPLPSAPSQQQELQPPPQHQFGGPLTVQFTSQYSDLPADSSSYYARPMSLPSTPMPYTRTSMDYFPEGIPTLHSAHNSMLPLPTSFGSLEQQQLLPPTLEDQNGAFDSNMTQDMPSTMFRSSMAPTEPYTSPRTMRTLSIDHYPAQPGVVSAPFDYSRVVAPLGRPKRGGGLREPFTEMATTHEPKFSPDKRKLCCVEDCTSQARAFNRCKRHGGSKRCSSPGCTKSVQSRGLCIRHGGGSRCQESGCTRASQSHGRCKLHGGGRPCIVEGCEKKAHLKRLCRKHGGGTKCCVAGCEKWSQRQGMCMTHSKVVGSL